MSQLPGRSPLFTPTRHANSLAEGIKLAQQQAPAAASPAAPKPDAVPDGLRKSDALRSRIVELFNNSRVTIAAFYQYSESAAALSEEYHKERMSEVFPAAVHEELTLATTLDARETPALLDKKLAELSEVKVKKVVYDRVKSTYYLYV